MSLQVKRRRSVSPEHIKPPKVFKDALNMMVPLWKMKYPKLKLPIELTAFPKEQYWKKSNSLPKNVDYCFNPPNTINDKWPFFIF
jgi:hypothetical protein